MDVKITFLELTLRVLGIMIIIALTAVVKKDQEYQERLKKEKEIEKARNNIFRNFK